MLQVPRQNLTSFTRTPLEVMMTCIVMLMIWKDGNCHVILENFLKTVISGDLASAIAVSVLEENDRNFFYFEILNFSCRSCYSICYGSFRLKTHMLEHSRSNQWCIDKQELRRCRGGAWGHTQTFGGIITYIHFMPSHISYFILSYHIIQSISYHFESIRLHSNQPEACWNLVISKS